MDVEANPRFRFDRNELAGAFGDIGTDLPLIVGMVIAIVTTKLLERLPGLRLADDGPPQWAPLPLHHGLVRLDVAWEPEAAA